MTLPVFPLAFPITQWVEVSASDPLRRQAGGVLGSGRDFVIDRGQPYWKISGKTRALFPADIAALKAFKAMLRGSSRYCTIWDPSVQYPQAYMPAGPPAMTRATIGGAFDGHGTLGAINSLGLPSSIGRDQVVVGAPYALPTGLSLLGGDHLELRQGVNLLTGTDFSSGWATTNCTLTANFAVAPDGTTTAAKLTRTATGNCFIIQTATLAGQGLWFREVIWLKLGTLTGAINIDVKDGGGGNVTVFASAPTNSGWQRFEMTGPIAAGGAANVQFVINPANGAGSAGDTLFMWDPRLTRVDTETISLHEILDTTAQVADGSGNVTLTIEPEVPSSMTAGFGGALANLYQPRGKFRITDLQIPVNAQGRARPGQCTFTAVSTLN